MYRYGSGRNTTISFIEGSNVVSFLSQGNSTQVNVVARGGKAIRPRPCGRVTVGVNGKLQVIPFTNRNAAIIKVHEAFVAGVSFTNKI